ncbi:conjugal transfer protein TraK [Muribaculum intestinale]
MPIKHLRRGCFVTHLKRMICYALTITAKHEYIEIFHQYFFNLPPDNDYIKWTVGKAMYMADGTALKQKQAMDENGFYSDIISSSAVCTIICDSINFDEHERKFTYYGTQLIKRRTRDLKRSMVTSGYIENVPRTENNPHGLMITGWRTIENKDLGY